MRTLVIDTALNRLTVAVHEADAPVSVCALELAKGHQERLAGVAQTVLAEAGGLKGIDRIGVTIGPGSFTGLRVGMAFAQGLATAANCPLVGLSTLDALALSVPADADPVVSLIDARRGQVYFRAFVGPVDARAVVDDHQSVAEAVDLAAARERILDLGPRAVLIGSGAGLFADLLNPAHVLSGPTALAMARLCREMPVEPGPLKPLYLRAPDATPPSRLPGQPRRREGSAE